MYSSNKYYHPKCVAPNLGATPARLPFTHVNDLTATLPIKINKLLNYEILFK